MPRKLLALLLIVLMCVPLFGCGKIYEGEYLSVTDYVPSVQEAENKEGRVTVRNFNALKQAIHKIIVAGEKEGKILVDAAYDGDIVEDVASACWELRTEDALCAYCVDNIAYDISKIVSYYEATFYISYSQAKIGKVVNFQYVTSAEGAILNAIETGQNKLVLLINRSNYTADNMVSIITELYKENPAIAPKMPKIQVNMFSGTEIQRLYEVKFSYGMLSTERDAKYNAMKKVQPFSEINTDEMSELERAYMACTYLIENCEISTDSTYNGIYDALVEKKADSEGLSYAYIELCRQLGISCRTIEGQRRWQDHHWNIVRIDGEYYHVDAELCASAGIEAGFMKKDSSMWENYRWDTSSYPECNGSIEFKIELLNEQKEAQ